MKTLRPLVENVTEAGTACLLTMVRGNVLALTLGHWLIASRTGLVAGAVATAALLAVPGGGRRNEWTVAGILALATGVVDYFAHPAQFGVFATEAILTGLGAGALSLVVSKLVAGWRRTRIGSRTGSP